MDDPKIDVTVSRALMALVAARAHNTGEPYSNEEIDQFLKGRTNGRFGLTDLAKLTDANPLHGQVNQMPSVIQGATAHWGDELIGMLPEVLGGGDRAKQEFLAREAVFKQEHPHQDTVGGLVGGLAVGAGLGGTLAKTQGVKAAVLQGMKVGAGYGAVDGAGTGTDLKSRAVNGATGAVVGAGVGAAVPGVLGGLNYLFHPEERAVRMVKSAAEESGGLGALLDRVKAFRDNGRGSVVMGGDLSPSMQRQADYAYNNSDEAFVEGAQKVHARTIEQPARLLDDVTSTLGDAPHAGTVATPTKPATGMQATLAALRKAWADGPNGYGGLRDANPSFDLGGMAQRLNKPSVQSALRQARLGGDLVAESPLDAMITKLQRANPSVPREALAPVAESVLSAQAKDAGKAVAERPYTFDDLQQFVRTLKGKAKAAWARGDGTTAGSYDTIAKEAETALEDGSPGFKAVNRQYAQRKQLETQLAEGEKAWDAGDSRGIAEQMAAMSPRTQEQFRYGMASKLVAQLRAQGTNRDAARGLAESTKSMQEKLAVVFKDQPTFDRFMQRVQSENDLNPLKKALGGSDTHRRGAAADAAALDDGVNTAVGLAMHPAKAALSMVGKGRAAITKYTASRVGKMMNVQGADEIERMLSDLTMHQQQLSKHASTTIPTGLMSLFNHDDQ